jgi:hypothetical protein
MLTMLAGLLTATVIWVLARGGDTPAAALTAPEATSTSGVFGVNVSLFDASDELITNPSTQAMLRSWGVPLIRLPLRSDLSDATVDAAMRAVLAIGATPMVILHGPKSGGLANNQHLLSLIMSVFGDRRVYLEYGNEADLSGVSANAYAAGWNQVIPALRRAAPAAYRFVGPVNFQADPGYAAAFAKAANPAPDYLSWHEYVCNSSNRDSYCTAHIANWANHASAVENAVSAAVGHTIPFFISEWNLDPNDTPRYANASFIQSWTRAALTQLLALVPDGLAGAMVYTATNHGNFGLINGGSLTPQGQVFRDVLISTGPQASSASPSGTDSPGPGGAGALAGGRGPGAGRSSPRGSSGGGASRGGTSGGGTSGGSSSSGGTPVNAAATKKSSPAPAAASGVHIGFEDGLDSWGEYWGYDTLSLSQTTAAHYDGSHALKIVSSGTNYVAAGTGANLSGLHSGKTVTFHVYASGNGGGSIQPFTMDTSSTVHWPQGDSGLPTSAGWFTLTFTIPSGLSTVHAIGLQLKSSKAGNWIALDGLSWPG